MKKNTLRISNWNFFFSYIWTIFPIVLACLLIFFIPRNQSELWTFVVIEWLIILLFYSFLCPWLGKRGIFHIAVVFIVAHFVSLIVTHDYLNAYGALHSFSDDYQYALNASEIGTALKLRGFNLNNAWAACSFHWTLSAWPILLGLLAYFTNCELNQVYAMSLSLNATILVFSLILIFYFFEEKSKLFLKRLIFFYWLISPGLFIVAGTCRKEILLIFELLICFVSIVYIFEKRKKTFWITCLVFGLLLLVGTRPIYLIIMLFQFVFYWFLKNHIGIYSQLLFAVILVLGLLYINNISPIYLRESPLTDMMAYGKMAANDPASNINISGIGYAVFHIPFAGPWIYYLVSPIPLNPIKFFSGNTSLMFISILESIGTLCYLFVFFKVGYWFYKKPKQSYFFYLLVFMYVALFASVVISSSEPRYKLPTNLILLIMVFRLWLSNNTNNPPEKKSF